MTKFIKNSDGIFEVLLLMIIAGSLLNINWFFNPVFASYYAFCLFSLIFIVLVLINVTRKFFPLYFSLPALYLGLCCFYILLRNVASKLYLDTFLIYMIIIFLLILTATTVFNSTAFNLRRFFSGILAIASLESCYCILQYLGFIKSKSEFFIVTGTWINPNVTAQFLAMCVPVFLYSFKGKREKIYQVGFTLLLIALILLKCRAALIGTVITAIVYFGLEFSFISWVKKEKNKITIKALIVISLLVAISLGNQLYTSKKASADGRIFIWKLSSMMILEKPFLGYGYTLFEKDYNLFQANYIKNDKATPEELQNAAPVVFAQNEFLQNAVEGGLVGLLLILCFLGSLLNAIKQKGKPTDIIITKENTFLHQKNSLFNVGYAGVLAFIGMSLVNFTIQSVPTMTMLSIFAALICSNVKSIEFPKRLFFFEKNRSIPTLVGISTITISLYLIYSIFMTAVADMENKKAFLLKKEGKIQEALLTIAPLESRLKNNREYWKNYAGIHFKTQNYLSTIKCIEKAKTTSANPELYLASGICYEKLNQYSKAIDQYNQLVLLHPSKFAYRFQLMNAYLHNKDTTNTITTAQKILDLNPKIPSEKVIRYKRQANKILKILIKTKGSNHKNNPRLEKSF